MSPACETCCKKACKKPAQVLEKKEAEQNEKEEAEAIDEDFDPPENDKDGIREVEDFGEGWIHLALQRCRTVVVNATPWRHLIKMPGLRVFLSL